MLIINNNILIIIKHLLNTLLVIKIIYKVMDVKNYLQNYNNQMN